MTEGFERELKRFQPRSAAADVRNRVQSALQQATAAAPAASPWADRCLLSMLSMAAAAVILITSFLLLDARRPVLETQPPAATAQQTHEYLTQLAGGKDLAGVR